MAIFSMNYTGSSILNKISSGEFLSVAILGDQVFATKYKSNMVNVYSYSGNKWSKTRSFKASTNNNERLTMSVKNNRIKCCSWDDDNIRVYTLTGQLLQTNSTEGSGDAGQLSDPFICDEDEDGSVLFADQYNDRLQVMTEEGKFSLLQLQPPVEEPKSAALFNNHLYVTSSKWMDATICKYTLG